MIELKKEFYTIAQTSDLLRCSRPTLYKWISEGEFQPYRKGKTRNRIIPAAQIIAFLEKYKDVPAQGKFCAHEFDNGNSCAQRIREDDEFCWMHNNA